MKNFTKQNFKTNPLWIRLLIMAFMLLAGTSSAWGWTVYYVNSTNWNKLYIHYWGGTNPSPSTWGENPQMVQGEKVLGLTIYSYEIGDNTSCIFKDNKGNTNNKTGDLTSLQPDKPYYYDGKWYSIREIYENFWMFYMYQSYGGTLCLKAANSTVASNTTTQMTTSGYAYVVVEKTKVDGKTLNVSNNCGGWSGTGGKMGGNEVGTEKVHPGCFYKTGDSNTITKASTLSSLSIASSINKADANSVAITVKSTSSTSSYSNGNTKYALKAMFYVDNKYYGTSNQLSTSETSTTLDLSDLADGQHTLSVVLTDGTIYYSDSKTATFTIVSCSPPDAPNFGEAGTSVCLGTQVTLPTIQGKILKWYDAATGGNVVEQTTFTATVNTDYYAVVVGDCESARTKYSVTIKTKPTVTLNPTENTVCTDVTLGDITDYVEIESTEGSQISWYAAEHGGDALATSTPLIKTSYFAEATLNGCSSDRAKFTITDVLSAPTEVPNVTAPETICAGESAVLELNNKDANYTYTVNEEEVDFTNNEYTVSPTRTTDYIVSVGNKCGSLTTTKTITVNPLPEITDISVNNSTPVINEDVLLTVEGGDIARVEWSITSGNNSSLSDDSRNSVKLTSTASGAVTVTATAISSNGCRATSIKEVTFSAAENCDPITDNTKIEIWCKVTGTTTPYCHAYNIKNSGNKEFKKWPGLTHTSKSGDYYIWTLEETNGLDISNNKVGIVFSKNSSGNNQTADITTFYVGNRYYFTYNANSNDKNTNYTKGNSEPLTTYPPLSAPAVKTVSATSEEGSGVVAFTGKVLKTGCATGSAIWVGYQYKKANEEWPSSDVTEGSGEKQLVSIGNNPGSEDFTAEVNVEGLADGDYHFRAYIINGYNFTNGNYDQGVYYGLDKLVTVRNTKTPISEVTLDYCDENGKNVGDNPNPMCKGEFAYMKLDYRGTTASEIKWLIDGEETNIVEETAVAGVYRFAISTGVTISVKLRNDANLEQDGETPAYETCDGLAFTMIAEPAAPYISINPASGVICDGDNATITVTNPTKECSYKLVSEGPETRFTTYVEVPLTYTVNSVDKYYVVAQHKACPSNEYTSNQVAITQVISTNAKITIEPESATTTPWEPVSITVTADEGYIYELSYPDNNLDKVEGVIIKQNGDTYTYSIPRPDTWGTGDASTTRTPVTYDIKAQLKVDGEANQCDLSFDTATITVKDEDNENCPQ